MGVSCCEGWHREGFVRCGSVARTEASRDRFAVVLYETYCRHQNDITRRTALASPYICIGKRASPADHAAVTIPAREPLRIAQALFRRELRACKPQSAASGGIRGVIVSIETSLQGVSMHAAGACAPRWFMPFRGSGLGRECFSRGLRKAFVSKLARGRRLPCLHGKQAPAGSPVQMAMCMPRRRDQGIR